MTIEQYFPFLEQINHATNRTKLLCTHLIKAIKRYREIVFWGMWFTVPFDIESNGILLQQSKFCSLYWSAIYLQQSISFRYTTWFNLCIYCKMITTILLVICHHRTKKFFFLWWKRLKFTFLATIKFAIWYY